MPQAIPIAAAAQGGEQVVEDEVYQYNPKESAPPRGRYKSAEAASSGPAPSSPAPGGNGGEPYGEDFVFELRGFYWMASLDAKIRVDSGELEGTELDVVEDLGFDRTKGVPGAEMTIKFLGRHKIKLDYTQFTYSTSDMVEKSFVFNGVEYPAESQVDAEIGVYSVRLGYEYDFYRSAAGYISGRLSGDYLYARASLVTNDILGNKASLSLVAPTLAVAGRWNAARWLSFTADVSGVAYDKSSIFDGAVYMDINPVPSIGFTVGWRSILVNIDVEEKKSEAAWSGLYGGVAIRI
ncbi:MAG: hypothetical protein ACNS63_11360 [Candidatus Nitrospinota bacterium M3_3B_026]